MPQPRRLVPLLLVLFGFLLASCSDGPSAPSIEELPGVYELREFNDSALPVTVTSNGVATTIESGRMVIRDDNTYTETLQLRTAAGVTTSEESGFFTLDGATITFIVPDEAGNPLYFYVGRAVGREITYTISGVTARYRRL